MNRSNKARWGRRWDSGILLLALLSFGTAWGASSSDAGTPETGTRLPSVLTGARLRNAPVGEPPAREGWIVYAFSPLSPKSEANQKRVEELARSLPRGWVLLAVSLETEGVSAFVERLHVKVPVLTQVPKAALTAYRVTSTPRTYVLGKDWKLLEILDGPFEGKVAEKLAARFKTSQAGKRAGAAQSVPPGGTPPPPNLCRDGRQDLYSRGADADALGMKLRCGMEGVWVPAP